MCWLYIYLVLWIDRKNSWILTYRQTKDIGFDRNFDTFLSIVSLVVFRYVYLGFVVSENRSEHNPLLARQIVLVSATRRLERLALISVIHGEESGHAIDRSFAQIHAPRIGAGISPCRFHSARVGVPLTGKDQRSSCGRRYTHNWPSSLETQSDRYLFVIRNLAGSRSWRTRPS